MTESRGVKNQPASQSGVWNANTVTVVGGLLLLVVALILWKFAPRFEDLVVSDSGPDCTNVLFIGNSLTFTGRVPAQFVDIAKFVDNDRDLLVEQITYPNYTLKDHMRRGRAVAAIDSRKWDYVVIQDHSREPFAFKKRLRQLVKVFDEEVRDSHGTTILFMTWTDPDRQDDFQIVKEIYEDLASDAGIRLAPIGYAVHLFLKEYPDIELMQADHHHMRDEGAFLVSSMLYTSIFKKSFSKPLAQFPYSGVSIDPAVQRKILSIVERAARRYDLIEDQSVDDEQNGRAASRATKEDESNGQPVLGTDAGDSKRKTRGVAGKDDNRKPTRQAGKKMTEADIREYQLPESD